MRDCDAMIRSLRQGEFDSELSALYAPDGDAHRLECARERAVRLAERFAARFGVSAEASLFSAPGRTELGGNHTDHQQGQVLCGSVDTDMLACAAPNDARMIRLCSEGYPEISVSLDNLAPNEAERGTSVALVRGVAARLRELGCALLGFDACITSDVLSGSGLSSSAAYEVLIGTILNHYCGASLSPVDIAKAGQYAENFYFGKPCGLMDQMGSAVGGAVAIDFRDSAQPVVRKISFDFSKCGHALCIIDTGSCHADLTEDYALIPREMGAVAAFFGKKVLREVSETDFLAAIPALRECCGDRAVLRAVHFYAENRRAAEEAEALEHGDFDRFLALVRESGESSARNLQNICSPAHPEEQSVSLALALGAKLLEGRGAIRVHGGGFAGTVQAFVPAEKLDAFKSGIEACFGPGACHVLHVRPQGSCPVIS